MGLPTPPRVVLLLSSLSSPAESVSCDDAPSGFLPASFFFDGIDACGGVSAGT